MEVPVMAFDRKEVEASFHKYVEAALEASRTMDFRSWIENFFTEDAVYIDRELGTSKGRGAIIAWMDSLMAAFPGEFSYRVDWYVIEGDRVVYYHHDGFPDPKTGVPYDCPVVSILHYAGDGRWCYEEDVYNAKEFEAAMGAYLAAKAEVEKAGT
jgi:hypothetical protein